MKGFSTQRAQARSKHGRKAAAQKRESAPPLDTHVPGTFKRDQGGRWYLVMPSGEWRRLMEAHVAIANDYAERMEAAKAPGAPAPALPPELRALVGPRR